MKRTTLLLCLIGLACGATDKTKEKDGAKMEKELFDKNGRIHGETKSDRLNKTKLLFFEYTFWSETRIFEEKTKSKEEVVETINATYSFDILHHDSRGKILGRYKLLECISGPCHYGMPDVYVDFIQGGNNLEGLYVALEENDLKASWNVLFAIVYSIVTPAKSGAGDEQHVVTPYGVCHYRFSKPEDKVFRRRMDHCQFNGIRNYMAMEGLTQQSYQHNVLYIQNVKVDADIVIIEAEEKLSLKSQLRPDWNLVVESKSKMQMTNRTSAYIERICPRESLAGECAQQVFKAKRLGRNWKEIRQNLNIGVKKKRSKLRSVLEKSNGDVLNRSADILVPILNSVLFASVQDLSDAVKEYRNASVMPIFVDALGLSGTRSSYTVGKDVLTIEAPEFIERFLQVLALTTKLDMFIVADLKTWMKKTDDEYLKKHIAFTVANLYRRFCESSKSRKFACDNGKDKDVNDFTDYITKCQDSDCQISALQTLQSLPLPRLIPYASQFLCNSKNRTMMVQREALRFLQHIDEKHFDHKIIIKLLRIFRNTCPLRQTVTDQTLAVEVLLNAVPEAELVGTYMLRSEELFPKEQEKWSYFYGSVARRRQIAADVNSYWAKMRSFRVFRANYAHRSLNATSDVSMVNIAELDDNNITVWVKTANDRGVLSWNDFSIIITSKKRSPFTLMQVLVETRGLQSYLMDAESDDVDKDDAADTEDPWTSAQLSLLNSRTVPVILFDGYGELLSAVWNADGQPVPLYDTNLVFRQYYGYVPLMSGLSITVDIMGILSISLSGSAAISLWNKDAKMTINSTVSAKLDGNINLASTDGQIGKATTSLFGAGTVKTHFDADFYAEPHLLCTAVSHSPVVIRHSYTHSMESGKERRIWRNQKFPASSLLLSQRASDHCSLLEGHFESN